MLTRVIQLVTTIFTPRLRRNLRRTIMTLSVTLFLLLWLANQVISHGRQYTYDDVASVPYNKVAVVLGTSKYLVGGGLNQYFENRIDATVRLWFSGKITQIIVSGDNATMSYNEPREMRRELLKRGIPAHAIYSDYAGFRTLDSILRAHGVFGQTQFTVVSQRFQNERAIFLARHHHLDVIGFNAKDVDVYTGFKTRVREFFARLWCLFDVYIWEREPRFMGEQIEVE
ncbi:ElyC/SanA/YdcF family protein [Tolumonas lignilytica]|uniref:ElyC/SanA/YdcF family protein n=1 Tax=Tolumonas lignilytica TaxID=1283284 RepID=UPI0004660DDC